MLARRGKVVWAEEKAYSSIAQGQHWFIHERERYQGSRERGATTKSEVIG